MLLTLAQLLYALFGGHYMGSYIRLSVDKNIGQRLLYYDNTMQLIRLTIGEAGLTHGILRQVFLRPSVAVWSLSIHRRREHSSLSHPLRSFHFISFADNAVIMHSHHPRTRNERQ